MLILLYAAGAECLDVIHSMMMPEKRLEMPLGVVIYLAIFDLGKAEGMLLNNRDKKKAV